MSTLAWSLAFIGFLALFFGFVKRKRKESKNESNTKWERIFPDTVEGNNMLDDRIRQMCFARDSYPPRLTEAGRQDLEALRLLRQKRNARNGVKSALLERRSLSGSSGTMNHASGSGSGFRR